MKKEAEKIRKKQGVESKMGRQGKKEKKREGNEKDR